MHERLDVWAERVRSGADEDEFVRAAEDELEAAGEREDTETYTRAGPFSQSYAGLARYWEKRAEAVGS
jgi:hypothetical protein